ncbi:uncharacterized protein LOC107434090 isoform X2 [Ziziphus jujuba]|uniref:Uncharacterized protein LOC107434090 isoform X2 n=1 Tax=Ziziphus jujuba TaxID=326968 RepID=A0ABM3I2H2_ZIZJJ|nr:uncharacterized protein LOC107434090 isoform X2 [Ziziphus jujuba]
MTRENAAMHTYLMAKRMKDFWDNWGIEMLMTLSCVMHMVLTLFGSSRRSKLTLIQINGTTEENTDSELKGFLGSLLLVQLGSRDAITAYSIEDDRLGVRQIPNVMAQICSVSWILFRCWNYTLVSYLYFPLLVAGSITYGENGWALYSSLSGRSGITTSAFKKEKKEIEHILNLIDPSNEDAKTVNKLNKRNLEMVLKAYCRFFSFKPHIEKSMYRPLYQSDRRLSINKRDNDMFFPITEIELGFMYDVLYTKAPIVYTRTGFALRLITSLGLVSCSVAFAFWFKDAFVYYINAGFTLVVLGVIITLEAYQIYMLLFSDWAIIMLLKHNKHWIQKQLLRFLASRSSKWKRWSNILGQFNLVNYCLKYERLYFSTVLELPAVDIEIRKVFCTNNEVISDVLKGMLIEKMRKLEKPTALKPNSNFRLGIPNELADRLREEMKELDRNNGTTNLYESVDGTEFDKSIILWHLATEICYSLHSDRKDSNLKIKMGRHLSNYMMYLLAVRSEMLSIPTSEIVLEDARKKIMTFLKANSSVRDVETACRKLNEQIVVEENKEADQIPVTKNWCPLLVAKKVSGTLLSWSNCDIWDVICSVWVEMLCFAAMNCPADCHSDQLRRGGEIVTHVWLILLHEIDAEVDTNTEQDLEGQEVRVEVLA